MDYMGKKPHPFFAIQRHKAKITKRETIVSLDFLAWILGCCYKAKDPTELCGGWLELLSDGPSRSGGIQKKLTVALFILAIHLAIEVEDCRFSPCRFEIMK